MRCVGEEELLPRFRAQVPNPVHVKTSSFDVFSEADQAAEDRISEAIAAIFPDALIVSKLETRNSGLVNVDNMPKIRKSHSS